MDKHVNRVLTYRYSVSINRYDIIIEGFYCELGISMISVVIYDFWFKIVDEITLRILSVPYRYKVSNNGISTKAFIHCLQGEKVPA
jgi:hypothetical protein